MPQGESVKCGVCTLLSHCAERVRCRVSGPVESDCIRVLPNHKVFCVCYMK